MNPRERYLATIQYGNPDCVPFMPGGGRRSTLERWHREGLPEDVTDTLTYVKQMLDIPDAPAKQAWTTSGVNFGMIPEFEEKLIEHRPAPKGSTSRGTLIVQDWKGNVCEISDEFSVSDLRGAPDFVTRAWIKLPVNARDDWPNMAARYDVNDAKRFADDFQQRCHRLAQRDYLSQITISGPFWQLREWLGFEGLCMMFLDDPSFVQEMISFWRDFVSSMLRRMGEHYVPDVVMINEDMAYKEKPMIGPDMCREFLLDCWQSWADVCREIGVPIYAVDSDGHIGELVDVWIDAGFVHTWPIEVAAGNDLPALSKKYGQQFSWGGGVDKRAIAQGGTALQNEIDRLRPVIDAGGYIPGCDHGIPSDVSWDNFVTYCRLLAKATGWLS